jgi:hypothetical protein
LQVPLADVASQLADVAFGGFVDEVVGVYLARDDDAELYHLELPAQATAGVQEAQRLIGGLCPAVEIVRARVVFGAHAVFEPGEVRSLVPFRRLVRAGRDHAAHAAVERELVYALHHVHVAPLGVVLRLWVRITRLLVAGVNHDLGVREKALEEGPVFTQQVGDLHPFDPVAGAVLLPNVEQREVVAFPERRQQLARDVSGSSRQQDTRLRSLSPGYHRWWTSERTYWS